MNTFNNVFFYLKFVRIKFFYDNSPLKQADALFGDLVPATYGLSKIDCTQQGIWILISRSAHYIATIFVTMPGGFYLKPMNNDWPAQSSLNIYNCNRHAVTLVGYGAEQTLKEVVS